MAAGRTERGAWRLVVSLFAGAVVVAAIVAIRNTATGHLWFDRLWPVRSYAGPPLELPRISCPIDKDGDGISDLDAILSGARDEVAARTRYLSAYYAGGYPPAGEGTCTDLVWRALRAAGYDLKSLVDDDIFAHTAEHPLVAGQPDPGIDFRRVPNLVVFFRKTASVLTSRASPGDPSNLVQWQGGDIVVFGADGSYDHIAVVSDRRRPDGVPYLIHSYWPYAREDDALLLWPTGIAYHFRFPKWEEESPGGG